jgi:hypothetical protein
VKIHGIEFPGMSQGLEDMPRHGWPNPEGEPPGSSVVRCSCGWVDRRLIGGGGEVPENLAKQDHAMEWHADRCPRAKGDNWTDI